MLLPRAETILKTIIREYITSAVPVPSQRIAQDSALSVCSATIRNEMAHLEQEGYILRPHPSAGSIPSDKGYRYYVETLADISLSAAEQRLISHLFHQVEQELEKWLGLATTLIAQLVRNVALVTLPKPADCQFKHLELVALQDTLFLVVLVLHGAKVKEQLITADQIISQAELTAVANKLNTVFAGLSRREILAQKLDLSDTEQQLTTILLRMMEEEDKQEYEEPYFDGWHFMLNQPEFVHSHDMLGLIELVEHRSLLKSIIPKELESHKVRVVIGKENKDEAFHNYSVVISKYGLPDEAEGTISVLGPTRMPYAHTISTVDYLSSVLTRLVAGLYGKGTAITD